MSPATFPLCGILLLVALISASNSIESMLQCQMPKDVNAFFTSKGINDPKSYCDNAIEKLKKECGDKKACEVSLKVTYKVKHLMKVVSNKLEKVPCTTTPDITDKVKKKIDEIIDRLTNETGEPDVGTEINPADSCKQVLVDLKKHQVCIGCGLTEKKSTLSVNQEIQELTLIHPPVNKSCLIQQNRMVHTGYGVLMERQSKGSVREQHILLVTKH